MRTYPKEGADNKRSGIWWALEALAYERSEAWHWIEKQFGIWLKYEDIDFKIGGKSALQLILRNPSRNTWDTLCILLEDCQEKELALEELISDNSIQGESEKLLQFYKEMRELKNNPNITKELIKNLIGKASSIMTRSGKNSEPLYLLATQFFNNAGQELEAFLYLSQVSESSIFIESAKLRLAQMLLTGQYDEKGELLETNDIEAKQRALRAGLSHVVRPNISEQNADEFRRVKRLFVARLLGDKYLADQCQWVDEETNPVELGFKIARLA